MGVEGCTADAETHQYEIKFDLWSREVEVYAADAETHQQEIKFDGVRREIELHLIIIKGGRRVQDGRWD